MKSAILSLLSLLLLGSVQTKDAILPEGFQFCSNTTTDILNIRRLSVIPFPPVAGQSLSFYVEGNVRSGSIKNGSMAFIDISIGSLAKIASIPLNICELTRAYNKTLKCPLKGPFALNYTVNIPDSVPPLTFGVSLSGKNPEPKPDLLTCINGTVSIKSNVNPNEEKELSLVNPE